MTLKYYKSLDRELNLFGIKGRWLGIFGVGLGAVLLLCFILGFIFDMGVAMGTFIAGFAVDFLICLVTQSRIPSRRLMKLPYSRMMGGRIVRRETLCKILLPEKASASS